WEVEGGEALLRTGSARGGVEQNMLTLNPRPPPIPFDKGGRRTVHRDRAKGVSLAQEQVAELRLAEADRVCQHGLEHWLQRAGRAANDAQHLRGRRLLLKGFVQLVEQSRVLDGDDSLRGEVRQ